LDKITPIEKRKDEGMTLLPMLIEIGVEELPAVPLLKIKDKIAASWAALLEENRFESEFEFLYTPRRLVLKHPLMPDRQEKHTTELYGPPIEAAIRDGVPTPAGEGFARKCNVAFDALGRAEKNGREVLYYQKEEPGLLTQEVLPEMIRRWIASMEWGKTMRWGDRGEEFIRPIRWLQVRLGPYVIDMELLGVRSDTVTYAHRMARKEPMKIISIEAYEPLLSEEGVMLRPEDREAKILFDFDLLEKEYGFVIERDAELLAEVVAITENPQALVGSFEAIFLELPPEVIVTSMKEHQRYFPVVEHGHITNRFVVVSNAYTHDYTHVIAGNERVLRPRLSDALFFYRNDLKNGLSTDGLEKVQFIDGLGTLADKIDRERRIAIRLLALYMDRLEAESGKAPAELEKLMDRAITLAKADLMSEMVYEFTELQGLMGYYYAKALGEDPLVYNAIREQYMPAGEGAELPGSIFSSIVAMSIKLDTLLGLFSVGKIPSGSKDPFALRRAVNGIVRIVTRHDLPFDIQDILVLLKDNYAPFDADVLRDFILERINKSLDANPSVIAAVLASGERDISRIAQKVAALDVIVADETFREQFSTFKRVANISKDVDLNGELSIETALFAEEAEVALYTAYEKALHGNYPDDRSRLEALFGLKVDLDRYFDEVMVNAEDATLRRNRQALIASIYRSFREIADIKEISV
jgi:glycyl-tRNA synthetase beta chain